MTTKTIFLILALCFPSFAQAKTLKSLDFSIGNQTVMSVRTLESVALNSEAAPVVSQSENPKQNGSFIEVPTEPDPIKKIWHVSVTLTPADADQFKSLTESNLGKICVVSANGETLSSPKINTVVPGGHLDFSFPNEARARRLFKMIKKLKARK
jgi:preprotein translocase subunit SecD